MNYSQRVGKDFSQAAEAYDEFATLQREVIDELLLWVPADSSVLDAGAGTGYALKEQWVALDLAEGMCQTITGQSAICADMQRLPVNDAVFDGVFSSLAMQWIEKPEAFLAEAYRCTKPTGWLAIATLGEGTLQELRMAFEKAGLAAPVLAFQSLPEIERQLVAAGWKIAQQERGMKQTAHPNVRELLHHLKGLGARYKMPATSAVKGKGWLQALEDNYPASLETEHIQISWEVIKIKAEKV